MKTKLLPGIALLFVIISCNVKPSDQQDEWIKGTEEEKLKTIERQFRGFDMAMVETGYRYQELFWAGQDQNWEYAGYQLEKIKVAIENGLQRRPKRAKSAAYFLTTGLPQMQRAINAKDSTVFNKEFFILTSNCNSCHAAEKVPFFAVEIPTNRQSPIRK